MDAFSMFLAESCVMLLTDGSGITSGRTVSALLHKSGDFGRQVTHPNTMKAGEYFNDLATIFCLQYFRIHHNFNNHGLYRTGFPFSHSVFSNSVSNSAYHENSAKWETFNFYTG